MQTYIKPLEELSEYQAVRDALGKQGVISVTGCIEAQRAHLAYGLSYDSPQTVIVTENDLAARSFYENYRFYEPKACLYSAKDLLFFEADISGNVLERQRIRALERVTLGHGTTVIVPAQALMDYITARESFEKQILEFTEDQETDLALVIHKLGEMGYERYAAVEMPGQFAVRGDILDIWNITSDLPYRLEFFGDDLESLRQFDAETQRSVKSLKKALIYPAHDSTGTKRTPFMDWFDKKKTLFILSEPNRIGAALEAVELEFSESVKRRLEQGDFDKSQIPQVLSTEDILGRLEKSRCVTLSALDVQRKYFTPRETYGMSVQAVNTYNNSFEFLVHDLERYHKRGYKVLLISGSHTRARRLADDLEQYGLHAFYSEDKDHVLQSGEIMVQYGHASRGFEYPLTKFVLISESDIFGEKKKKKKRKKAKYSGEKIAGFSELSVGDYVVHENYGLGIYRGIEKMTVSGAQKDYIKLEYKGSNLYILATQLDVLQKYSGADGHAPRLNKIGGNEWQNTKAKVKKAVSGVAANLVKLYAARQAGQGYRCQSDTPWQREFEELFPYEETDDQLSAIEDVKRDMESGKIMDRLVCGDVGYGKTEIALRAAFKAVQEDRQVVVLVPTTILAQQHYNTFSQRMRDFPVRVDLMSRFRSTAQQNKTIADLKEGKVDIVIGTHRLLSKDISFKNLGLLIVDEEQRFGVTHKERIKEMRQNVDVLTLTATPIPRTLHMSLIGIRDMSVLEEPPQDRVPIQTYVLEYNEELVREAICRELNRHGQVYYVYNRVRDIADVCRRIQNMVPEANVAYADGQMAEHELENIMVDFINGEIDVLVTTTIIETGLDIANVNTMIIQDADRMGLSQLYQLRGRIGRSNRTAYAYLMYRRDKVLKEVAEKRLAAIREFTELGSGIKIAMRDLEIRGAGNLLGAEQHGHMEAVGYDLYCKMLSEAVRIAKGENEQESYETLVDLNVNAFIPDKYIPDGFQKMDVYKRIALIENDNDYEDMSDELMDRFGELPKSVKNLLSIARIKAYAHAASMTEIKEMPSEIRLNVLPKPAFDAGKLPSLLAKWKGAFSFHVYSGQPCFLYKGPRTEKEMLANLLAFCKALAQC
ncbi:MAG: transcription-repair coupling factor [Lachnospiraceae bacterium]|nr:transcription-repair coupling factor [Candidatus Equihabitans merdae]